QEGILFHHLMEQEGDPYLLPSLFGFESRELLERFVERVQQVVDRHDILRTRLAWENLAQPVQVVLRKAALQLAVLDAPADQDVQQWMNTLFDPATARLDIREAPLLCCHAAEDAANGRWLLHILAHHLVVDHTTLELLLEEAALIEQGLGDTLPPPVPFRQFVAQARLGVTDSEHEHFFRQLLGHIDEPTAPFGLLDVQSNGANIAEARLQLDDALATGLREQARAHGVSTASLMHLAWALVLARTSGRDDVVFGTVLFGRMQGGEHADRGIGLFINTLPLCLNVAQQADAGLKAAHKLLAQLLRHEHAPLSLAQRCSGVVAPSPLFTSLLNYRYSSEDGAGQYSRAFGQMTVLAGSERTNYPLTFSVDDLGQGFLLTAQVAQPISPQRVCQFMHDALASLLDALTSAPHAALKQLNVL
ncbi:Condensation domain-containing protein, partial [Andreprevotia lacus DSM 23236]